MKVDEWIQTNRTSYKLNYLNLNLKYDLACVCIENYDKRNSLYKVLSHMDFITLSLMSKNRYLILFEKGTFKKSKEIGEFYFKKIRFTNEIYSNCIVQLLINQIAGDKNLNIGFNKTPLLYISKPEWERKRLDQRYALEVKLDWKRNLIVRVVTFTKAKENEHNAFYFWNDKRGLMQRSDFCQDDSLYKIKNPYSNNNIDFVDLGSLEKYENSKLGVINFVVNALQKYFEDFFIEKLKIKKFPIEKQCFPGRGTKSQRDIFDYFNGASINIFLKGDDENNIKLMNFFKEYNDNLLENVNITFSNKPSKELNIQILRDVRKDKKAKEDYIIGSSDEVIQHITPDGFGKLRNGELNYSSNKSEFVTTLYNLAIKEEINSKKLKLISKDLIQITSKYEYFWVNWLKKNEAIVYIVKMTVDSVGNLTFIDKKIDLNNLNMDDELSEICGSLFNGNNQKKKYFFDNIECVIRSNGNLFMILRGSEQVIPFQDEIHQRVKKSDINSVLSKKKVINDLKFLKNDSESEEYISKANEIIVYIKGLKKSYLTIGEIHDELKNHRETSFRNKLVRNIFRDLENRFDYTFNNSVRQKEPYSLFPGFKGMGFTRMDGELYYYVGDINSLKENISRTIRLRRIVFVNGEDIDEFANIFDDLSELMRVQYIRNGQYTVIPFPVKYMREYFDLWRRRNQIF